MTAMESGTMTGYAADHADSVRAVRHGGWTSAFSVVLSIAVLAAGLFTIATVSLWAGLLIVVGAAPLWGWACVRNKDLLR
jgi:hypothetical protein